MANNTNHVHQSEQLSPILNIPQQKSQVYQVVSTSSALIEYNSVQNSSLLPNTATPTSPSVLEVEVACGPLMSNQPFLHRQPRTIHPATSSIHSSHHHTSLPLSAKAQMVSSKLCMCHHIMSHQNHFHFHSFHRCRIHRIHSTQ